MSYATALQVEQAWLAPTPPPDTDTIEYWLGKASREIRRKVPDLEARLQAEAETEPDADKRELAALAADVAVDMVLRKLQNPLGLRTQQRGTGPLQKMNVFGGDRPGELMPTPEEIAKLRRPSESKAGSFSIVHPHRARRWPL